MTLVVSDVSRYGFIMVGDSAVSIYENDNLVDVRGDAAKIHYSDRANMGIAMWGCASVGKQQLDSWIAKFIRSEIDSQDDLEMIGQRLAHQLNEEFSKTKKPWSELVCGFHLAGFRNGKPKLWHIHCGHENEPPHELRLYKDFPELKGLNDEGFQRFLTDRKGRPFSHLRNGYHPIFASLFDSIMRYSVTLNQDLGINFPQDSFEGRLSFYKLLVQFVADTLVAAGEDPCVNNVLSSIAFSQNGLIIDERIPVSEEIEILPEGFHLYYGGVGVKAEYQVLPFIR
ncbi:MAG: hypothetical protein ACFFCW_45480 [Candidatus Hodarchaeota archaeon]